MSLWYNYIQFFRRSKVGILAPRPCYFSQFLLSCIKLLEIHDKTIHNYVRNRAKASLPLIPISFFHINKHVSINDHGLLEEQ